MYLSHADIDQDGIISRNDIYEALSMVTDSTLSDAVKERIVDEVSLSQKNNVLF